LILELRATVTNQKLVQRRAMLLSGLRKAHKYFPVALIGIHADEVFLNLRAAWPLNFIACSAI